MTPAERLRAAADTIERTAKDATCAEWVAHTPRDDHYLSDVRARRDGHVQEGIVYRVERSADAAHVALWDPPTALLAARILRDLADRSEKMADALPRTESVREPILAANLPGYAAAVALADRILTGGAS